MTEPSIVDGDGNQVEGPPVFDANDPMVEQVSLTFSSNTQGATMDIRFPPGVDMDETNILHVLAWYVTNAAPTLLPIAIQSWHAQRLAMLQKSVIEPVPSAILGQDGKPLIGPEDC
jgi:hypothetical protein